MEEIIIPSVYLNKKVSTIASDGFLNCIDLQNIEIPSSVTTIKDSSFAGCINLQNIEIPNSVTTIENRAFNGCKSLEKIVIPKSVKSIGIAIITENEHGPEVEFEDVNGWQRRYVDTQNHKPYTDWENIDPSVVADSKNMRSMFTKSKIVTSGAYAWYYWYEFQKV